jgi:SAM-dependent methyltransferase
MFGGNFPLAVGMVHQITEAVPVPAGARILDHLAGGGEWGISLSVRHPDAVVVARDTPELLAGVRQRVADLGLTGRFTFAVAGSEPPGPYDVVVLAQVGRFVGTGTLARLVREAAGRLRPTGRLVLADVLAPGPAAGGGPAAMIDLSLLVNTRHGRLLSRRDYEALLAEVGLRVGATAAAGLLTALIGER